MPRKASPAFTGLAAASALLDCSTRLHKALMGAMHAGSTVLDSDTCLVLESFIAATTHLESHLAVPQYEPKASTFEPLAMIGTWMLCEDGVVHNMSEWREDQHHRMACGENHKGHAAVTEANGHFFCNECRVLCYLPGEEG